MPDGPIQASSAISAPLAPPPRAHSPAAKAAGPAVATDSLAIAHRPPAIEADVRLAMRGRPLLEADGTVKVRRGFLERFIQDVLSDKRVFPRMKVGFDPANRRFTGEGQVRWLGVPWPSRRAENAPLVD